MTSGKRHTRLATTFRLVLEYDGTRYSGWQKQGEKQSFAGVKTITNSLVRVLHNAGVKVLHLAGSGRTDAGVHALGQVACLHVARPIEKSELAHIFESELPYDIAVRHIEPCDTDFDPRRSAFSRTYLYQVALRKCAFFKNFTWLPKRQMDLDVVEKAWTLFEGNHVMNTFADLQTDENARCQIFRCQSSLSGNLLLLRVTARSFLRKQVRRMVGAVIACSTGNADIRQIRKDLKDPSQDSALFWAERTAPAAGLFLESVNYSGKPEENVLSPAIAVRS